jgi:hypothetical protein
VSILDTVKRGAAALTDHLAVIGERMPGLAQLTITAGGVTATVTPKPPPPPPMACPTCGAPKP